MMQATGAQLKTIPQRTVAAPGPLPDLRWIKLDAQIRTSMFTSNVQGRAPPKDCHLRVLAPCSSDEVLPDANGRPRPLSAGAVPFAVPQRILVMSCG